MSSGLTGTMTGMDVQTQYEALQKELAAKAAQEREAANQQAQQALMGYQQAAAAPAPQLSPADVFVPTLISNIASVLSQDQGFRQRAQEGIKAKRSDLMQARIENLSALRDNYLQKAKAAEDAGDATEVEAARLKVEQLSKTSAQLLEQQKQDAASSLEDKRHTNRESEIRLRGQVQQGVNAAKPKTGVIGDPGAFPTKTTVSGREWRDLTGLTGNAKNSLIIDSASKGIPALMGQDAVALKEIQIARLNQQKIRGQIEGLLPSDWKQRPAAIANLRMGAFLQSNKMAAAFGAWREMAIQQLKAAAAVTGNRQAQRQFELVLQNDIPQLTDTVPVALARMDIVDQMLGSREDTLLSPDLSKLVQQASGAEPMVKLRAPDGTVKEVPESKVQGYIARGAKRVK